jgi:hypothetical protein
MALSVNIVTPTRRRQWNKLLVATIGGAVASAFAAPMILVTLPVTAPLYLAVILPSIGAGVIGGATTQVIRNVVGAEPVDNVQISPRAGQDMFRVALRALLDPTIDSLIQTIKGNRARTSSYSYEIAGSANAAFALFGNASAIIGGTYRLVLRFEMILARDRAPYLDHLKMAYQLQRYLSLHTQPEYNMMYLDLLHEILTA